MTRSGATRGEAAWKVVAVAGVVFFLVMWINGWAAPWKGSVLFDCPPLGDGAYVDLDPYGYYPDCEYFGPPISQR